MSPKYLWLLLLLLRLYITFKIYSRFNGLNPLLDEVPSFLGNRKRKKS